MATVEMVSLPWTRLQLPGERNAFATAGGGLQRDSSRAYSRALLGLQTGRAEASSIDDKRGQIMRLLLHWVLSALAVWIVAQIVPGIHVSGAVAALIAALVIGFINATLGALLKILTFPLTLLTLGLFWFVINALMLKFASVLVSGFRVDTFFAAFVGAILLSLVNMVLKWLVNPRQRD
jgi:putative membrane protein